MTLLSASPVPLHAIVGCMAIGAVWQGFALTALIACCLRVAGQTTAALRFALWTAALLLICLLPLIASNPASKPNTPLLHLDPRWSLAVAATWLTLSLVRAADLLRHALRLRSLSLEATPTALHAEFAGLLRARNVQLCTSRRLERPGVIGFFHPRILIPVWLFEQLTAPELEQIVLHELEHLRRRDDWLNLLQKLALVVFPLNPALYWVERRLCLERELACDESVVRRTRAPRLYATCLARLAERGLDHRNLPLALSLLERQSELARRVSGILRSPRTFSPRQSFAVASAAALLLLGGSVELARMPQVVSFAVVPPTIATNSGTPRPSPETWVTRSFATPVLYTDAAPRLIHASLRKIRRLPHNKAKLHQAPPPIVTQGVSMARHSPAEVLATELWEAAPAPNVRALNPTLVRYTLVQVEGGWFLLQL